MDETKILITGANGQLGRALQKQYPQAKKADVAELDITNEQSVQSYDWSAINTIINAAGYTNVDGAETPEGRVAAWKVNAQAVANLAKVVIGKDILLVHVSTDYIFDGTKNPHTEDEPFSPLSIYGSSKAAGDIVAVLAPRHYLIRTTWVVGEGKNFVRTMLEIGRKGTNPTVVADQIGRPTFATEIARAIDHLLTTKQPLGVYNVSNEGEPVSWADLARQIFKQAGLNVEVTDTTTEKYASSNLGVAPRPLNSVFDLSKIKAAGFTPRDWHEDLVEYINKEMKPQQPSPLDAVQGAGEE